jgi:hypothetical protein
MEIDFGRSPDPSSEVSIDAVQSVINILASAKQWLTALEIAHAWGSGFSDRKVRRVASAAAPRIVSYPGSPDYRLFELCTVEEIDHGINAFRSQGNDMIKRSVL